MAQKYQIEIDVDSRSLGELEDMLQDVNEELKDLDRNSDAFKEAAAKSQILSKEIEKINNEIEGFDLEDKIMAADGAAKVFGGSLSAVVGTLGTLGIESEAFGEFEEKAASAIAVGLGIKDVSEGFGQLRIAIAKSGGASKLFGITTKKALIATGVGAFVVAIGSVVAYWDEITTAVKRFGQNVPFVGKAIELIQDSFNSLYDAAKPVLQFLGILPSEAEEAQKKIAETSSKTIRELQREIALAQARGDSERELFKLREKLLQEELSMLERGNAEKDEIYKKETELLALQLAEQKRLREESEQTVVREKVNTVNAIKTTADEEVKTEGIKTQQISIFNKAAHDQNAQMLLDQIDAQAQLDAARQNSLNNIIAIAGTESRVGRAALIAKQVLSAQEMIINAKKTLSNIASSSAEAGVSTATGFAQTLKAGFPQNIPLLIAYAAQAYSIGASIASAIGKAKSSVGAAGGGVNIPSMSTISAPTASAPQAPAFNVVGASGMNQLAEGIAGAQARPQRAYVVANDVTTAQGMDRNIVEGASI